MLTETSGSSGLRDTTSDAPLSSVVVVQAGTFSVGVRVAAGTFLRSGFAVCAGTSEAVSVAATTIAIIEPDSCELFSVLFLQRVMAAVGSNRDFLAVGRGLRR